MSKQEPPVRESSVVRAEPGCCAPLVAQLVPAALVADLAAAFKALGDPVRLRLLSMIASHAGGEVCVCDLTPAFDLSGPTISHHLKVLREAGLIDHQRRGTWVYYWAVQQRLATLAGLLDVGTRASRGG